MPTNQAHARRTQVRRTRTSPPCIPMRTTDAGKLVTCAAAGEQWAWTALIVRFRPSVMAVARRHRLCPADCDEVAQRTWLQLLRSISRIERPAQLGAWVSTTARNESLRVLANQRRDRRLEDRSELYEDTDVAADEDAETEVTEEHREALDAALDRVADRERALMRLLMLDPTPSYQDISVALGMPVGSIGPTRARCLARLRRDARLTESIGCR